MSYDFTSTTVDAAHALKYPKLPKAAPGIVYLAMSPNGQVFAGLKGGGYVVVRDGVARPILVNNTTNGFTNQLNAVNDRGDVVGRAVVDGSFQGFALIDGVVSAVNMPSSADQAWGSLHGAPPSSAPLLNSTKPMGISAQREIIGMFVDLDNHSHGFVRDAAGAYTQVDAPNARETGIWGYTADGGIFGVSTLSGFVATPQAT